MHGDLVAFVPSRDLESAARFYGSVLGLPLIEATEFALVYDAGPTRTDGNVLSLQQDPLR